MMLFMLMISVVIFVALLGLMAIRPKRSELSHFELVRRSNSGDETYRRELQREKLLIDVISLQRSLQLVLLVFLTAAVTGLLGWWAGMITMLVLALFAAKLAQAPLVAVWSQKVYERYEGVLLEFIASHQGLARLIRLRREPPSEQRVDSREELEHLIQAAPDAVTANERKLLMTALTFGSKKVSDIMTPRSVIDSISKDELLGPLVLDDLHKTGHSRFPVVEGDIDHIHGMLYVHDLLTLDKETSLTAEAAMDPRVYYIREDQTLERALAAFLRTRHHLFIVINEFRETVGVLSLEDVIEAMVGRKIVDEFDAHDDLRAVATRNPRDNNHGTDSHDV